MLVCWFIADRELLPYAGRALLRTDGGICCVTLPPTPAVDPGFTGKMMQGKICDYIEIKIDITHNLVNYTSNSNNQQRNCLHNSYIQDQSDLHLFLARVFMCIKALGRR